MAQSITYPEIFPRFKYWHLTRISDLPLLATEASGWLGANPLSCSITILGLTDCGFKILLSQGPSIADACGDFYTVEGITGKIAHLSQASDSTERKEVFGASAGAAIYRRSMLYDIGVVDEDFFITHEDTDLSFRAQSMGYKYLYVPSAIVYHRISATLGRDSDMHSYYGQRSIEFVFFRNMPLTLLFEYLPLHLITIFPLFLVYLRRGRDRPFIKAKLDALRLLPRMIGRRRGIQRKRRVPAHEIDRILTKGWLESAIGRKVMSYLRPRANTSMSFL